MFGHEVPWHIVKMVRKFTFTTYRLKSALSAKAEYTKAKREKAANVEELGKKWKDELAKEGEKKKSIKSLTVEGETSTNLWQRARYTAIPGNWKRGTKKHGYMIFIQTDTFYDNYEAETLADVQWDPFVSPIAIAMEYANIQALVDDTTFLADCFATMSRKGKAAKSGGECSTLNSSGDFRLAQGGFGTFLDTDSAPSISLQDNYEANGENLLFSELSAIMAGLGIDQNRIGVYIDTQDTAGFWDGNIPKLAYYGTPEQCVNGQKTYLVDRQAYLGQESDMKGSAVNEFSYDMSEDEKHVLRNITIALSVLLVGLVFAYLISMSLRD